MKIDRDICEDEGLDALEYYWDSQNNHQLGKNSADHCDDYWEDLAS